MGTSSRMNPSIQGKPNWSNLSSNITRACDGQPTSQNKLGKILGKFVSALGGAKKIASGQSSAGGRAGISAGQRMAGFFGNVASSGFIEALDNIGLGDLGNKSTQQIINELVDYCAQNANTIDEVAARASMSNIFNELLNNVDIEDMEEVITKRLNNDGLYGVLADFFGHYIYEHLSTRFKEKLNQAKDPKSCNQLFAEIKGFIFGKVKHIQKKKDLSKIDWSGNEGNNIIKDVFESILQIYEEYED